MNQRIAIFIANLNGGGVQRVYLNLAGGLIKQGLRVDLIVGQSETKNTRLIPADVRVFNLNQRRSFFTLRGLVKYIKKEQPDVLLTAQTHINLIGIIAKMLSRRKIRLVVSEHIDLREVIKHNLKERRIVKFASYFYGMADEIIAVSKGVADSISAILKIDGNKIKVIHNPLISEDISRLMRENPGHPWFENGSVPVVIAIGRLVPQKDFVTLVNAFAMARQTMALRLFILGEGFLKDKINNMIDDLSLSDEVKLAGIVENPFQYLSRASMFVLSSLYEGFPSVLVEAMACGIPVVSTDCPSGPREILEDGKLGRLVPVGNAEALGRAIIDTIKDPYPLQVTQNKAMEFNVDDCTLNYLQVLLPDHEVTK